MLQPFSDMVAEQEHGIRILTQLTCRALEEGRVN